MATAVNPKAAYYEHELQAALCRGAWAEASPGKTPKAIPTSWEELLRKYRKHCQVADLSEVASQTQAISLLLVASRHSGAINPSALDCDCINQEEVFNSPGECTLSPERVSEARVALATLDKVTPNAANASISLAKAYILLALGETQHCIDVLSRVDFEVETHIPTTMSIPNSAASSLGTSSGLSALESVLSKSGTLAGSVAVTNLGRRLDVEVGEGKVWAVTERIRGKCLEGIAYERLQDLPSALKAYDAGIPLLDRLAVSRTTPQGKAKSDLFVKYRELWRWAERIFRGAVIVSAKLRSTTEALRYLRLYSLYSAHWPSSFRPVCRSVIYTVHLRALCLSPPGGLDSLSGPAWREESRRAAAHLKVILGLITEFPRAGEVNHKVLDFVDLCVAVWEKGGAYESECSWVVDTLWWATRLTFHSQKIMRHLSHLLYMQGEITTATRTFNLYVQLVSKARQTSAGDVSLQLKRRPTEDPAAPPAEISEDIADEENVAQEDLRGMGLDADSDRTFVLALTWGINMLARAAKCSSDAKEIERLAALARTIALEPKLVREQHIQARATRAQGLANTVMALYVPDARLRSKHQLLAVENLTMAAKMDPSAAGTFYQLALAQAALRDIPSAILSARTAVEKHPTELRAWHLLGLLLTAQGDWNGAKAVLELGLGNSDSGEGLFDAPEEDAENDDADGSTTIDGLPTTDTAVVRDFAISTDNPTDAPRSSPVNGLEKHRSLTVPSGLNGTAPSTSRPRSVLGTFEPLLPSHSDLPPSYTLLAAEPDTPRRTYTDRFEADLQLRATQLALNELVDGAETANVQWPDVFAFFSQRCPSASSSGAQANGMNHITIVENGTLHDTRTSMDGSMRRTESPINDTAQSEDTHRTTSTGGPRMGELIPPSPTHREFGDKRPLSEGGNSRDRESVGLQANGTLPKRFLHRSQRQMHSIGRRVTHEAKRLDGFVDGSVKGLNRRLHRTSSAPDFHSVMGQTSSSKSYQASSIHSRSRFSTKMNPLKHRPLSSALDMEEEPRPFSPPPPLPEPTAPKSKRPPRETRLLSDLWLTSAATFRRLGKLEQARAAIQEAEVMDEENPNVWIQFGLLCSMRGEDNLAVESFHKALVIDQDNIGALVHLAQQYLKITSPPSPPSAGNVDLAAGMLTGLTEGQGWDVPEAWYFLAKACGLQGRKERERECLIYALQLQETRCIRALGSALPICL